MIYYRSSYRTPVAFRQALTDKLKIKAQASPWALAQLQRQIAYDRLLERLYLVDESWIVKGAIALLAREIGVRATIDIDVYREVAYELAGTDLRRAASLDIGDWFRFEVGANRPISDDADGIRIPASAYIGQTIWASFHVDLVGLEPQMTGTPDQAPPICQVSMPDLMQHGYRVYPLIDHIADKVMAIIQRYGENATPSTRYKDLVDLVALARITGVDANSQRSALVVESNRRGIALPDKFDVPDHTLWTQGYAVVAAKSLLTVAHTLDEALAIVRPFIDPLLDGSASGRWDPHLGHWSVDKPVSSLTT